MDTKNVMMSALLLLVISLVPLVNGGSGCTFNGAPKVEQVATDKFKVSWSDVVPNLGCLDFFVINYWEKGTSKVHDGKLVGPLGDNQFSTEIEVKPRQRYKLQLKTIKNGYSGRSYGESEIVEFKADPNYDPEDDPADGNKGNDEKPKKKDEKLSMSIELKYYIIAICGVIGGLIVIGIIYKLVCKYACNKKSSADLEMSLDENNDGSVHKDLLTAE